MVLLVFVAAGALIGFAFGGRLAGLGQNPPRGLWLCILSFFVQGAAAWVPVETLAALAPLAVWQLGVALLRYGLLLGFVVWNIRAKRVQNRLRSAWPWIFGAGTAANAAVILANGGAMPVAGRLLGQISPALAASLAAGEVFGYTLETDATRLTALGDILYIGAGRWSLGFASIGDLFIGLGAGFLVFCLLRAGAKPTEEGAGAA